MTFFRSEEHLHKWAQFDPATEDGIITLEDLVKCFSGRDLRRRLDSDYFSRSSEYGADFMKALQEVGKTSPFWSV